MKNWATGVDAAKILIDLGRNLGKLVSRGSKASMATGKDLKNINEEALKELKKIGKEQAVDLGSKVLSKTGGGNNGTSQ
jgi:hypothetical protein